MFRRLVPRWAVQYGAALREYVRRLVAWVGVLRVARGRSPKDAAILRKSALAAPRLMANRLFEWRDPQLLDDAELDIYGLGVFSVRRNSDDLGHVLPQRHADLFRIIASRLALGHVAIDAGSNIGAIAVYMAKVVGPKGRVIAVEMMPHTASRLRRNLALNGLDNVTVIEKALSSRAGETVSAQVAEGLFGQASIAAGANPGRAVHRVDVTTTTLDAITEGVPEIAVLKMDLEGAESMALAGAAEMLMRTRAVIFESWDPNGGETSELLTKAGFTVAPIDGRNYFASRVVGR